MKPEGTPIKISSFIRKKLPRQVKETVELITDKKGENITVLEVKKLTDMTDFIIICTGRSTVHNRAISDWILLQLKKNLKVTNYGVEGSNTNEWVLMDYVDFVVHIMLPDKRRKYQLEKLWMDANTYHIISD
jgi:ribosome-associated protein